MAILVAARGGGAGGSRGWRELNVFQAMHGVDKVVCRGREESGSALQVRSSISVLLSLTGGCASTSEG